MSGKNSGFGFGSKGGNVNIADPAVGTFGKLTLYAANGSQSILENQVLSVKGATSWTIGLQGVPGTEYPLKDRGTTWKFYADRKQLSNRFTANVAAKASGKPRRSRRFRRRRSLSRKRLNNI